jgi:antitoxin (DNA-binding transcriptional repressor) of toxin-antitoxin stability system
MAHPGHQPNDVSVRQFVADSGAVTRGLRQGHAYTLTLNGEPLAKMIPIRRRQAVPKEEVLAIFAAAPVIDVDELRSDLDAAAAAQDLDDPYEGTGLGRSMWLACWIPASSRLLGFTTRPNYLTPS